MLETKTTHWKHCWTYSKFAGLLDDGKGIQYLTGTQFEWRLERYSHQNYQDPASLELPEGEEEQPTK